MSVYLLWTNIKNVPNSYFNKRSEHSIFKMEKFLDLILIRMEKLVNKILFVP